MNRVPSTEADIVNPDDPVLVKYPLITARKAATVFSVVNYFLGSNVDFNVIASPAANFDNNICAELQLLQQELSTKSIEEKNCCFSVITK